MLPSYLMLDLETTGGNPVVDRITEIAAVRIEAGREVARWSSLVNPGTRIPALISSLTGISDAMVADAPRFEQVASKLLALLDGAVLVAHNARFDHGFLKNEFGRIDIALRSKLLCTVRLSRKLYPQHRGHGLDAIMLRHGLQTQARHRAMGDVDLVLAWLRSASSELGPDKLAQAAQELLGASNSLPPHLESAIAGIPDSVGVYLFYGDGPQALYVGKSVHLRGRVLSHFQSDHKAGRGMRLAQETRRIETRPTAGEFGALLLEARLVKTLQPVYNRLLRREASLCTWRLADAPAARPLLSLVQANTLKAQEMASLYGVYRSRRQALLALRALADEHALCPMVLGIEPSSGRCFAHQLGRCRGACCAEESAGRHRLRVLQALAAQRLQAWPFAGRVGLREHDAASGRSELHVFDQWCHLATVSDEAELDEALADRQPLAFDLDTYRLLCKQLPKSTSTRGALLHLGGARLLER